MSGGGKTSSARASVRPWFRPSLSSTAQISVVVAILSYVAIAFSEEFRMNFDQVVVPVERDEVNGELGHSSVGSANVSAEPKSVLITGAAGFIGFHLAKALLKENGKSTIVGLDNFNDYYDVNLKMERAWELKQSGVPVIVGDVCDQDLLRELFEKHKFTHVAHLAAQAGVRYSTVNPYSYVRANIECFVKVLEIVKDHPETKFIYASSSSVYGVNKKQPFSTKDSADSPASIYGATKKANEGIAHAYHEMYNIPVVGLRFFTVYGPYGRPDMAVYDFSEKMMRGDHITVYQEEGLMRDFTFIDDIVEGVVASLNHKGGFEIFNIGKGHPEPVGELVSELEKQFEITAKKKYKPMPLGDVLQTYADTIKTESLLGVKPSTSLAVGIQKWKDWFVAYKKQMEDMSGHLKSNPEYKSFLDSLKDKISDFKEQKKDLFCSIPENIPTSASSPNYVKVSPQKHESNNSNVFIVRTFLPENTFEKSIVQCSIESALNAYPTSVKITAYLPEAAMHSVKGSERLVVKPIEAHLPAFASVVSSLTVSLDAEDKSLAEDIIGAILVWLNGGVYISRGLIPVKQVTEQDPKNLLIGRADGGRIMGSQFFAMEKGNAFMDSALGKLKNNEESNVMNAFNTVPELKRVGISTIPLSSAIGMSSKDLLAVMFEDRNDSFFLDNLELQEGIIANIKLNSQLLQERLLQLNYIQKESDFHWNTLSHSIRDTNLYHFMRNHCPGTVSK
eukprot:Nk52_evm19s2640 gene=Nk52_evmTU19s2640